MDRTFNTFKTSAPPRPRRAKRDGRLWVALETFVGRDGNIEEAELVEQGRIYDYTIGSKSGAPRRELLPDERTIACPQCGERFADTEQSAEQSLEMHIEGDPPDSPSICTGAKGDL